jgi:hypothetical protein
MRGRVMGIWTLMFGGMIPLGSLEAGVMADFIGTPATMAIGALICALAVLVTLHVIRKRKAQLAAAAQSPIFRSLPKTRLRLLLYVNHV